MIIANIFIACSNSCRHEKSEQIQLTGVKQQRRGKNLLEMIYFRTSKNTDPIGIVHGRQG